MSTFTFPGPRPEPSILLSHKGRTVLTLRPPTYPEAILKARAFFPSLGPDIYFITRLGQDQFCEVAEDAWNASMLMQEGRLFFIYEGKPNLTPPNPRPALAPVNSAVVPSASTPKRRAEQEMDLPPLKKQHRPPAPPPAIAKPVDKPSAASSAALVTSTSTVNRIQDPQKKVRPHKIVRGPAFLPVDPEIRSTNVQVFAEARVRAAALQRDAVATKDATPPTTQPRTPAPSLPKSNSPSVSTLSDTPLSSSLELKPCLVMVNWIRPRLETVSVSLPVDWNKPLSHLYTMIAALWQLKVADVHLKWEGDHLDLMASALDLGFVQEQQLIMRG